jgi:hypothetical protein
MPAQPPGRYRRIVEKLFRDRFVEGSDGFDFTAEEMRAIARRLRVAVANPADVRYYYRARHPLPDWIGRKAPSGKEWAIKPSGDGYRFSAVTPLNIAPDRSREAIEIPDATPGIIVENALTQEQSTLAVLRYNRLVDIFTRVTCYSLQSHVKTQVSGFGQVEVDELYVGVDKMGRQYVFPVEAKGEKERLGALQIENAVAFCRAQFPHLTCRPLAAQKMSTDRIALFEFVEKGDDLLIREERHYRLVVSEPT